MTPNSSRPIQPQDPLLSAIASQREELLWKTIANIKICVSGKYWYSACTLAAALAEETDRQAMGYLIITRFLEKPLIDDICRVCKWKMSCVTCQELGKDFFTILSDTAFAVPPKPNHFTAIACLQATASIWPDASSHWVYISLQKALQTSQIMDVISLAIYLKNKTILRFVENCSSLILILAKQGNWRLARRIDLIATSFARAKGLLFRSPIYSTIVENRPLA